ncbi:MAG: hypothetical protein E7522_04250 [Ruminococcaceae bacterium]|nr:hypothetical protein [Oscillospiraceae bacterium]
MSEEIKVEDIQVSMTDKEIEEAVEHDMKIINERFKQEAGQSETFRFFKNCSGTLKKLSVAVFVVNLFIIVIAAVLGVVMCGMYIGFEVVAMLAVPIISVVAILVIFARLTSALIYGFAEIVEKHEK